jgi:ribosomal protein S18 acetylase RimI-like enzyme
VINAAYRVEDFFVNADRTNETEVHALMTAEHGCFLVVDSKDPDRLAGSVYVDVRGARGYLGMLAVDPTMQNRGLGRRLATAAEAHCRSAGCHWLDISIVNLRLELSAFYEALGFTPSGTEPFPQPGKLRRDAHLILMSKPLT